MRSNDAVEQARLAGARRRALDEGREPPPQPEPPAPAAAFTARPASERSSARPDLLAGGAAVPSAAAVSATVGEPAPADPAAPPAARGPWFDARAFFLGWLAMLVALFAGASGLLIAAAGFGVAYLLARRSRLANAAVSVAGGTIASLLVLAALFVTAVVFTT